MGQPFKTFKNAIVTLLRKNIDSRSLVSKQNRSIKRIKKQPNEAKYFNHDQS